MVTLVLGVFVYPTLFDPLTQVTKTAFGLSTILFVGHALGLVAHYELFSNTPRPGAFCPPQERAVIWMTAVASIAYVAVAVHRIGALAA